MKMTSKLFIGLMFLTLISCEKDDNIPDLAGYLSVNIKSNNGVDNLSLDYSKLRPIENLNTELDLQWNQIDNNETLKTYTSKKILTGTYVFSYRIKTQTGLSSYDYELSNFKEITIQIFPGETAIVDAK